MKEFNLSEKELRVNDCRKAINQKIYFKEDVKEFIKLRNKLDADLMMERITLEEYLIKRDKLAGDELIDTNSEKVEQNKRGYGRSYGYNKAKENLEKLRKFH